jgi:hypothetical protein
MILRVNIYKGKRGYSASNFFLLSNSIVFDVEIKIQVTEIFQWLKLPRRKNSVKGVFLTIWGNKDGTFFPILTKLPHFLTFLAFLLFFYNES